MDYLFETLEEKRFQQLCQALLTAEFPNTQCFPVAQPDGGRDATAPALSDGFIVFQVKFRRNPYSVEKPHRWLADTLEEELTKIQSLIPKGAKQYYLLTNISGTAGLHPNFPPFISRVRRLFRLSWGVSFVVLVSCSSQFFRPPFTL